MNAGRFERLDEAAGKTQRHTVFVPHGPATPCLELDDARGSQWLAIDAADEFLLGRFVIQETAAEYQAVANPMLQRNAPSPSGIVRNGARVWRCWCCQLRLSRGRAI